MPKTEGEAKTGPTHRLKNALRYARWLGRDVPRRRKKPAAK
jgi:hypothetical protein